jgi:uncharacterized protein YjeT (DUF2065 family)
MIQLLANICNYSGAATAILFGIVYVSNPTFLSYHQAAAATQWKDLDTALQTLILALMRVVGGGALAFGFVAVVLQYQFSKSLHSWIPLTILVSGSLLIAGSLYGMLMVRSKTKGRPPFALVLSGLVLLIIGYLLNNHLLQVM